jgi:hypothetical protein
MDKREHHALWKREYRKKNSEYRKRANEYMKAYSKSPKGREIMRKSATKTRDKRRVYLINFFGGKCVKCGFSNPLALHMDHTNGRKGEKRLGNIDNRYFFVKKFPKLAKSIYQLLCANCNFIKMHENKEYRKQS